MLILLYYVQDASLFQITSPTSREITGGERTFVGAMRFCADIVSDLHVLSVRFPHQLLMFW